MKWNRAAALALAAEAASFLLSGCGGSEKDLLLHLAFDEGSGTTITDSSGHLPDAELNYLYTNAVYMDSQNPQWREAGIQGGSLLFDGNSTYITYNKQDLAVEGSSLTYQNIEQSWIEFSSYTLQAYAMPICDALSQLVPARQRIDMDWNKARRSDTKSRWEALQIAVGMGLLTLDEARDWEGMPPRDDTAQTISNDTEVEA